MADELRGSEGERNETERQGVREPQPTDLGTRREFGAADVARSNEGRAGGQPATGEAESMESRSAQAHSREDGEVDGGRGGGGVLDRVRDAWARIRGRT